MLSVIAAIALSGCMTTNVKQNNNYQFPIQMNNTGPALIFPISLHGVPGNKTEVGLAISAGVVAERGASVISTQQLYSLVGNLSYSVAENMRRYVNSGKFSLPDDVSTELKTGINALSKALKSAGAIKDDNFSFKHAIVLHVDSAGGISIPGVKRVIAFGGIIDLEKQEVVSYIEKEMVLANDHAAILAQMPVEMNGIITSLLGNK